MTREEIMKMDDRELYEKVVEFVVKDEIDSPTPQEIVGYCFRDIYKLLGWCYRAEEKIKKIKKNYSYMRKLTAILDSRARKEGRKIAGYFEFIHAHPRDRARAILMTVEGK